MTYPQSQFRVLTDVEIAAIHEATLRILQETGVVLTHPGARAQLAEAGAIIYGDRVRIPSDLVEWALAQCPPQVTLRGRSGQTVTLGNGALSWHNLGGAREVYDPRTGQRRPATIRDVQDSARLLDALESVTTITPFFTPQDVPGPAMSLAMYRHTLSHTTKPVHGPGIQTPEEVRAIARMASVIGPPEEVLTLGISPVSPLFFPDDVVGAIIETARLGIPLGPLPCPIAGATAPLSLAGALAQQNAEVLTAAVLAQLIRPGLPIFYCGRLAMMEPRSGTAVWGGVELGLVSAATVQIAHRYSLPVNVYGFSTNSHTLDIQSGFERALNAVLPALAGADELSGIGEMEAGVMGSYAQMVCDDEIARSIRRLLRGFAVDEDALAVEVIAAVMEGPRNFLGQRHTARYLRAGEILLSRLAERRSWGEWDQSGREGMAERAQAEAERLLAEHEVPPLSSEQERELDDILRYWG
ncbi:MAG: trimethylamine methyltransferase family protein [Anaerolineae bacterium]|nr:trimethylamine methyltransferase family protein [Anaerolineae bacterium]MDW7991144.1 trimethylamine methyltransferase family protein [Anaerolineae bacterium]